MVRHVCMSLGAKGLRLYALRAVLHRLHRQNWGETWQNLPLRPATYHFRNQCEVRSLIWNTLPGNAKGGHKYVADPHNASALFTHSQAGKPSIFGHQNTAMISHPSTCLFWPLVLSTCLFWPLVLSTCLFWPLVLSSCFLDESTATRA